MSIVYARLIDVCLPGYFLGSSQVTVQAAVDDLITSVEILDGLDIDATWDDERRPEDVTDDAIRDAVRAILDPTTLDYIRRYLEPREAYTDGECVYAYFALSFV